MEDTLTNWWVSGHHLNLVQRLTDEHSHLHGESANRGGKTIITSHVLSIEWDETETGAVVLATTKSGNVYRLNWAKADPAYKQWVQEEQHREQIECPLV